MFFKINIFMDFSVKLLKQFLYFNGICFNKNAINFNYEKCEIQMKFFACKNDGFVNFYYYPRLIT